VIAAPRSQKHFMGLMNQVPTYELSPFNQEKLACFPFCFLA